jgi:hypothetical protein
MVLHDPRRAVIVWLGWMALTTTVSSIEILCVSALRAWPGRVYRWVHGREIEWIPHDRICTYGCIGSLLTEEPPCFELVRPSTPRTLEGALFFAEA